MECNRDEALRAKEIAVRKFAARDIGGAKKFALKAQNLFPSLEGINQMIATLDVYLASAAISEGEKDWYAVLSVHPSADDETLKKQYRKLALQLHPDKNKSIGAEGAFRFISEAWSILSDKTRRMLYDQKRKLLQSIATPSSKNPSAPNSTNIFSSFMSNAASRVRARKRDNGMPPPSFSSVNSRKPRASSSSTRNNMPPPPPPSSSATNNHVPLAPSSVANSRMPPQSSGSTNTVIPPSSDPYPPSAQQSDSKSFWTSCNHCKMQYEHLRVYVGRNLLCPNCKQPFVAVEVGVNTKNYQSSLPQHQKVNSSTKNVSDASSLPSKGSSIATPSSKNPSAPNSTNIFSSFMSNATSRVRARKRDNGMPPPSSSSVNSRKPRASSSSTRNNMPPPPPPPSSSATNNRVPLAPSSLTNSCMPPQSSGSTNTVIPPSSDPYPPSARQSDSKSFWTSCNRCKMQYEHRRVYVGRNLLCPNCKQPFVAVEVEVNTKNYQSSLPQHQKVNSSTKNVSDASSFPSKGSSGFQHGGTQDVYNSSSFQCDPFSIIAGVASATASSTAAAQAANVVQQTYEKVRREREEAQAAARRDEALRKYPQWLNRNASDIVNLSAGSELHAKRKRVATEDVWTNYGGKRTDTTVYNFGKTFNSHLNSREYRLRMGFPHVRNILIRKSKNEIVKTLEKWNSAAAVKSAEKENAKKKQKIKVSTAEKVKEKTHENDSVQAKMDELKSNVRQASTKKDLSINRTLYSNHETNETVNFDVPDPDFHDFDKDRSEKSFHADEIWATYDDEDGMPRYYVFIQKVISIKPFKVRMSFLNSKSNSEFSPLDWVASGFAKTSGDFRIGRYEVKDTLNVFSHKVKWEKGPRGVIKVVPKKGDIWALYRNWSSDWNEHTPDKVIYKYDMVEVLEDYNEEQGVSIAPLVKVAGFITVFRRHMDPKEVKRIQKEEMFRFSHQVPSYVLTGEEDCKAPKGCYELDPASTPFELLQIVPE